MNYLLISGFTLFTVFINAFIFIFSVTHVLICDLAFGRILGLAFLFILSWTLFGISNFALLVFLTVIADGLSYSSGFAWRTFGVIFVWSRVLIQDNGWLGRGRDRGRFSIRTDRILRVFSFKHVKEIFDVNYDVNHLME